MVDPRLFILPTRTTPRPILHHRYTPHKWHVFGSEVHAASCHGNVGMFLDMALSEVGATGGFIAEALGHPGDAR